MNKIKKIALIIMAVVLMAVCFVFGASAETWGDYEYTVLEDGTVEIAKYNGSATELIVPSEIDGKFVTVIGDYSFESCSTLKNVTLPENIVKIGECAFYNCNRLTSINIPDKVETIGILAFSQTSINKIDIPDSMKHIGMAAFQACYCVDSITIPNSYIEIEEGAFWHNPFLKNIIVKSMDASFGQMAIGYSYFTVSMEYEEFADLWYQYQETLDESILEELEKSTIESEDDKLFNVGTIYCHAGSTAEAYAIENGVKYELTHFFEGEWTYDYDNMVRTRKCIHCDELQVEELEIEEISGDNFLVVEETVSNGIEGDVEVLKAFDINLKNSEGVHVQPDGSIKVKLPNDWSKSGIYKVYRVNDDGTLTDMNAYREGSHLVFDTDHFSIYVIVFTPDETTEEEPDTPAEPDTSECSCICHKEGWFFEMLTIVFRFVTKLLGVFPTCDCGIAHY